MLAKPLLHRLFPFVAWWPRVDRNSLRADAIAGLVGAVVVLPQGVAYATLAGLPPEYGLYCAMVPTVVAALFGSSLHAVSGPTNAVSLMVLTALTPLAAPGSPLFVSMALTLSLMSGLLILAMGFFRLGVLVNFISNGVIIGFTAAIGIIIIASQLAQLFGTHPGHATAFFEMLHNTIAHLNEVHPWALAVGVLTIVAGALTKHYAPRLAPMLVATAVGAVAAHAINFAVGAANTGIRTLGALPGALPPLSLPDVNGLTLSNLLAPALAVTILSVTQAIAIVRAIAIRSGQRIDTNQELVGQGLSNIAAAFFSGYPSCASVNRCGINYESGARTPVSAVLSAVFLVLLLLVLAPVAALLPHPAIAGLLVLAGWGLIDFGQMRMYLRTSPQEAAVVAATLIATLVMPLAYAILVGVMASLVVYLHRTSRPIMRSLVPDPRHSERKLAPASEGLLECPQLKILSVEGSIYFGAVDHVEAHFETLRQLTREQRRLLLVSRNINFVDVAGAETLVREARKRRLENGQLFLQGLRQPVEQVLRNSGFIDELGPENVFRTKREAIAAVFAQLDRSICARCRARIFDECAALPPAREN
ncbi:MAG: SulP family inorganic anion transporter [Sphingomonadaceae bacterium]